MATVPAGETWIVKHIVLSNIAGVAQTAQLYAHHALPSGNVIFVQQNIAAAGVYTWEGWLVLTAGDALNVNIDVQPIAVWVSGTRLIGLA